jgi:hypothetical protein
LGGYVERGCGLFHVCLGGYFERLWPLSCVCLGRYGILLVF